MKSTLTTLALFVMALMLSASAGAQNRSHVTGYFALDLDGAKQGVIAPIDNKGNATFLNVKPGDHSVALLLPAIQKVREAAARSASIEIDVSSYAVVAPIDQRSAPSVSEVVVTKSTDKSSPQILKKGTLRPKTIPLTNIVKHNGEEYYKIELENVLVSSYQVGGSGGDRPMESLSLNFTKIQWDVKENKK
jgi:type VI protein secretion system component Hcp